jgi:hypothetical protein
MVLAASTESNIDKLALLADKAFMITAPALGEVTVEGLQRELEALKSIVAQTPSIPSGRNSQVPGNDLPPTLGLPRTQSQKSAGITGGLVRKHHVVGSHAPSRETPRALTSVR